MNSNTVGNIGEIKAIEYLTRLNYHCYTSTVGNGPVDIIAIKDNKLLKIECKSSNSTIQTKIGKNW